MKQRTSALRLKVRTLSVLRRLTPATASLIPGQQHRLPGRLLSFQDWPATSFPVGLKLWTENTMIDQGYWPENLSTASPGRRKAVLEACVVVREGEKPSPETAENGRSPHFRPECGHNSQRTITSSSTTPATTTATSATTTATSATTTTTAATTGATINTSSTSSAVYDNSSGQSSASSSGQNDHSTIRIGNSAFRLLIPLLAPNHNTAPSPVEAKCMLVSKTSVEELDSPINRD
ncbi:hypothetical protein ACLB2K_028762 [Fragaria x ananassa]